MRQEVREKLKLINNGQVPKGYTQTKFGIFPIDWKIDIFKNIGHLCKGKGIPNADRSDNGYPCITYGEIYTKYNINFSQAKSFLPKDKTDLSIKFSGNILMFSGSGETNLEIGKCICYTGKEDLYVGGDIIVFEPDQKKVSPVFLSYQQSTTAAIKEKFKTGQGHSVVHIYKDQVAKLHCALPQLAEQEKIASVLEEWDKAIGLKTSLIEQLKKQKQALMQTLLTPKPDWQKVKLGDILHERNEYMQKGQSLTHVTLSKEGVVDKTERYERDFLVKDEEKKYKITKFNDICYNPANLKFGVICRNNYGSAIFSPIYVTYEVKNDNDPMFVEHFITRKDFINQVRKYEQGTVYERMAVHSDDFLNFKTSIPKPEQQQKIAEVLSMADEQIELQQKELEQLGKQKKALMQLLLTGIVRGI